MIKVNGKHASGPDAADGLSLLTDTQLCSFCQHGKDQRTVTSADSLATQRRISLAIGSPPGSVDPANHGSVYSPIRQHQTWQLSEFWRKGPGVNKHKFHVLLITTASACSCSGLGLGRGGKMSTDGNKKQFWKRNAAKVPGR